MLWSLRSLQEDTQELLLRSRDLGKQIRGPRSALVTPAIAIESAERSAPERRAVGEWGSKGSCSNENFLTSSERTRG